MEQAERWKNLEIWKLSDQLAHQAYKLSKSFPKEERYGITSQLRRAALSIPTNIVEGYARKGDKELAHFLDISFGSLAETKYLLCFSRDMGYIGEADYDSLEKLASEVGAKMWKFREVVRASR